MNTINRSGLRPCYHVLCRGAESKLLNTSVMDLPEIHAPQNAAVLRDKAVLGICQIWQPHCRPQERQPLRSCRCPAGVAQQLQNWPSARPPAAGQLGGPFHPPDGRSHRWPGPGRRAAALGDCQIVPTPGCRPPRKGVSGVAATPLPCQTIREEISPKQRGKIIMRSADLISSCVK